MAPDASKHNPTPDYLRGLIQQIGVSQKKAARMLGIHPAQFCAYFVDPSKRSAREAPYLVQYALERWSAGSPPRQ